MTESLEDGTPRFIWEPIDRANDDDLPTGHGIIGSMECWGTFGS